MSSKSARVLVAVPTPTPDGAAEVEATAIEQRTTASARGRRPKRIRIPFVCDVVLLDDPDHIAMLNAHPAVSREITPAGRLLNRVIGNRIYGTLVVGSDPLPVFVDRTDVARAAHQAAAEKQLTKETADWTSHAAEIEALARYVAGAGEQVDAAVAVQQLVGRLFVPGYRATSETYAASRVLAGWVRANPVKAWWWRVTGTLARSRALLWSAAKQDPIAVHTTTIAFHNVVDALDRMRALAAANGPRGLATDVVARCLVAPPALLRSCLREVEVPFLDQPLARGTLIVFRLERAHAGTGDDGLAFLAGEWSQCPAHRFVPELLAEVWEAAAPLWPIAIRTAPSAGGMVGVPEKHSLFGSMFWGAYNRGFSLLNRILPWYRLPTPLAVLNLLALRNVLREQNLYDTEPPQTGVAPEPIPAGALSSRTVDGSFTDLANPRMGCAGSRFGRNMAPDRSHPDLGRLLNPNPRLVSQRLLRRERFVPATTLNLLAAAWIQFQVHDWFLHKTSDTEFQEIPLDPDDDWFEHPMRVRRSVRDLHPADPPDAPPAYANTQTHWWDASQIYGSTQSQQQVLRSGKDGKLKFRDDGRMPFNEATGIEITGFSENWWVGLSLLHDLFAREHNAICDALRRGHPGWGDDRLFETARLINAALIAKIHTVEWTPAILAHPALKIGMNANWWGLVGERLTKIAGRISGSEAISGIPGSATDHHSAAFSLTEEFVSVYRMHPLMPDDLFFYALDDGRALGSVELTHASGRFSRALLDRFSMGDLFYTFGVTNPGAVTLHNYPRALQDLERPNGDRVDLASIEIFRDRERGIPRYNEFRRLLHMQPARTFEELTDNPEWARQLREVYGEVEDVDLMVGMYSETPPPGFGFSDTAFRIFILMASRRLKSDRFFTVDFTPEVYTRTGIDWVQNNDMRTVLIRHYPELFPTLHLLDNAFAPWRPTRR